MKRPMLVSGAAFVGASLLFLHFGNTALLILSAAAAAVFLLWLFLGKRRKNLLFLPVLCLAILVCSLSFLINNHFRYEKTTALSGKYVSFTGKVIRLPKVDGNRSSCIVETEYIGNQRKSVKLVYTYSSRKDIELYSYISVSDAGLFVPTDENGDPYLNYLADGTFLKASSKSEARVLWQSRKTILYECLRFASLCGEKSAYFLGTNESGLLQGMLFGVTGSIPDETLAAFRESGISHLLSVSGLNTSLLCGLLMSLLTLCGVPEKRQSVISIFFLAAFCMMTGFTPSVMRAAVMMLPLLIAPFFRKKADSLNSLGLASSILLLLNPYLAGSSSFLLSVFATAGVIAGSARLKRYQNRLHTIKRPVLKRVLIYIAESVLISFYASVFTLPVSVAFFGTFCPIGPLTNIFAVQPSFYAMILGFVAICCAFVPKAILWYPAFFLFRVTSVILDFVLWAAKSAAAFRFSCIPVEKSSFLPFFCAALLVLGLCLLLRRREKGQTKRNKLLPLFSALTALFFCSSIFFGLLPLPVNTTVTVLDVGSGLSVCIRCGSDYALIGCEGDTQLFRRNLENAIPQSHAVRFDLLVLPSFGAGTAANLSTLTAYRTPEKSILSSFTHKSAAAVGAVPKNTVIDNSGGTFLWNKINIEVVDTPRMYCVIIESDKRTAMISLYAKNNLPLMFSTYGKPDVLIVRDALPDSFSGYVDTLVFSCDSSIVGETSFRRARFHCKKLYTTIESGSVTLPLRF